MNVASFKMHKLGLIVEPLSLSHIPCLCACLDDRIKLYAHNLSASFTDSFFTESLFKDSLVKGNINDPPCVWVYDCTLRWNKFKAHVQAAEWTDCGIVEGAVVYYADSPLLDVVGVHVDASACSVQCHVQESSVTLDVGVASALLDLLGAFVVQEKQAQNAPVEVELVDVFDGVDEFAFSQQQDDDFVQLNSVVDEVDGFTLLEPVHGKQPLVKMHSDFHYIPQYLSRLKRVKRAVREYGIAFNTRIHLNDSGGPRIRVILQGKLSRSVFSDHTSTMLVLNELSLVDLGTAYTKMLGLDSRYSLPDLQGVVEVGVTETSQQEARIKVGLPLHRLKLPRYGLPLINIPWSF